MKVLWITNIPIGDCVDISQKPMGGLWMDVMLNRLKDNPNIELIIATTYKEKSISCKSIAGINYYFLPGGLPVYYKRRKKLACSDWESVFKKENPDVIQVWGTEYSHSVYALEIAKKMSIPSVVYIQGINKAISRYARGGISFMCALKYITLRDIYRNQLLCFQDKWFEQRAKTEKKILSLSSSVIVENNWAEAFCKSINSDLHIFKIPLSLNHNFLSNQWDFDKIEPHTIICNASGVAYKGLHVLLRSLLIVREKYPDVKLYVPGGSVLVKGFINIQKKPGYYLYITKFIKKNKLEENIVFTGYLTQSELAFRLSRAHIFVMSSSIENHSSSLKEAMLVGIPSIASQVGGVPEYFEYNQIGYSYRYDEYECLANYIIKLFESRETCELFSKNSRKKALSITDESIISMTIDMYSLLAKKH